MWPGDPPVKVIQTLHLDQGDPMTISRLEMSAHTGTHVDAPMHFIQGGTSVDVLDLRLLVGPALVTDAPWVDSITPAVLESLAIPPGTMRLLIRTRNSHAWQSRETEFNPDFVAITADSARWLVQRGVQLVGVDYLSVGSFQDPVPTHQILLRAGVIIVEGLNLSAVRAGIYQLVCLPLLLAGIEGAPARAILIESDGSVREYA